MFIKRENNRKTVIFGDFNTPLLHWIDLPDKKSIKETAALNSTLDQIDVIYIFRLFHRKAAEYTYFSSAHGMFSRRDHLLGHKTSLNKFKKFEIILSIFSDHDETSSQEEH